VGAANTGAGVDGFAAVKVRRRESRNFRAQLRVVLSLERSS
jgi:hypothetical protein